MGFAELDRSFIPLKSDGETEVLGALFGHRFGDWLRWSELLEKPRVVVLAEAKSGKTEEFRGRADALRSSGKSAFFLRVEDLADEYLTEQLAPEDRARLEAWSSSADPGWFFVDSVDEARLNHKSFDRALKCLVRGIGLGLDRARIYISSRASDWKGRQDLELVERLLPIPRAPELAKLTDPDELLLKPIFEQKSRTDGRNERRTADHDSPVLVVRLAPLNGEQRSTLARFFKVADDARFVDQIERRGLSGLANRPGDLLELAEYWREYRDFSSLRDMMKYAVTRRLSEPDFDRADSDQLSEVEAQHGVERVAAALTLCQVLTLRAPGQEPDPRLTAGALDPRDVLPEWTTAQVATLLRRGVFVPATYGRIRLHHRSTQEFLTASWLTRLLGTSCPCSEVLDLLFVDKYGVRTVVPSLRPVAAWLSLDEPKVQHELLSREPLELMRHGDPGSLSLEAKKALLREYARKQGAGEVSDDTMYPSSYWMFSDPELASTIREVWAQCAVSTFRMAILGIMREGKICACVDLARSVALNKNEDLSLRVSALHAMSACNDIDGMTAIVNDLMANPSTVPEHEASSFSEHLFPHVLQRDQLLQLIKESIPATEMRPDGFSQSIQNLWGLCINKDRACFLEELADICLSRPFPPLRRLSARHQRLAGQMATLALAFGKDACGDVPSTALVKACAVVERSDNSARSDSHTQIAKLVQGTQALNRALFWFDVEESIANPETEIVRYQNLSQIGALLWKLSRDDEGWLLERIGSAQTIKSRRVVLSALAGVVGREDLRTMSSLIRTKAAGAAELEADLDRLLGHVDAQSAGVGLFVDEQAIIQENSQCEEANPTKLAWRNFSQRIRKDSSHLTDRSKLSDWDNSCDLLSMTTWLEHRTGMGPGPAARQWRLLGEAFGEGAATAYRTGMSILWRVTPAQRVRRTADGSTAIPYVSMLSVWGIGIESSESDEWVRHLKSDEVTLAAQHGSSGCEGWPDWMPSLACAHPQQVMPIIGTELANEWQSASQIPLNLLEGVARADGAYLRLMGDVIIERILHDPCRVEVFDLALRILARLTLSNLMRVSLSAYARAAFEAKVLSGDETWAVRNLALWILCDCIAALDAFERWIASSAKDNTKDNYCQRVLGELFSRDWPLVLIDLETLGARALARLVLIAYRFVRVGDDVLREGVYSPGVRDRAESARSRLLGALTEIPGRDTYEALLALSQEPGVQPRERRFREIARRRAEKDAEAPPWLPLEVNRFEIESTAPVKTGSDLFRVFLAIASDIQLSFLSCDVSSRRVLRSATNEEAVQEWFGEALQLRARSRFHVHREPIVAQNKEPDVVLSSSAAPVQVAIEVKHGGKAWTVKDLEEALTVQLAETYLKPANRRYGALVITHHGKRYWENPETRANMTFSEVVERLRNLALLTKHNSSGMIEVRVIGLDASG